VKKYNRRDKYRSMIVITSLVVAFIGLAGLSLSNQTASAQDEEPLYLPLVLNLTYTRPEESIMILTPGSGSDVINPVHISGVSDPTFENNLEVRILLADGTVLEESYTTIQADIGERGPFELDLEIDLDREENIFIQVFDRSARDGGIIHLSSVAVTFTPTGPEDIVVRDPYLEQITIFQPQTGNIISGGVVRVRGFALAGFEQALLVEVQDQDGVVIAFEPVTVESPELGIPGPFEVEIEYTLAEAGPGRIVVRDVSPAHGDNAHLSSVEVTLQP
jgi:hypothetical protein